MSGHSKWSNIKRRKGAVDAKRGAIFTKIGREIQVVVRDGGPDPDVNTRLQDVIAKAKRNNMPNDTIARSIQKAAGSNDGAEFEEITYEGYGPHGVAVIVRTLTDNRNRTAGEVRHAFDKNGGNLGTSGCVSFMFQDKGEIYITDEDLAGDEVTEDQIMMEALELGADDVQVLDSAFLISTSPENYSAVNEALEKKYNIEDASVGPVADNFVSLDDESKIKMQKLIDQLEDSDDVQDVYHNWEDNEE